LGVGTFLQETKAVEAASIIFSYVSSSVSTTEEILFPSTGEKTSLFLPLEFSH